jgi:hypothetical protein
MACISHQCTSRFCRKIFLYFGIKCLFFPKKIQQNALTNHTPAEGLDKFNSFISFTVKKSFDTTSDCVKTSTAQDKISDSIMLCVQFNNTGFFAVLKPLISPTYTNFRRHLKSCDIVLSTEVLTRFPILTNQL